MLSQWAVTPSRWEAGFLSVTPGLTRCGDLLRARPGVTERNPASQRLGVTAHCDNMIVTAVEILEQMLREEEAG